MVDLADLKDPSPWHPIKDPVDLKTLGKFVEELGECVSAVARCIIQGLRDNESEPVTGKPNMDWLEDEIADVMAGIHLCTVRFDLNKSRMIERTRVKIEHLRKWHAQA